MIEFKNSTLIETLTVQEVRDIRPDISEKQALLVLEEIADSKEWIEGSQQLLDDFIDLYINKETAKKQNLAEMVRGWLKGFCRLIFFPIKLLFGIPVAVVYSLFAAAQKFIEELMWQLSHIWHL